MCQKWLVCFNACGFLDNTLYLLHFTIKRYIRFPRILIWFLHNYSCRIWHTKSVSMRKSPWRIGDRQGSCPPSYEQSTSDEDVPSTPTPPETPPILNDDHSPLAAVVSVATIDLEQSSTTNKTSSNVFSRPLSSSFRRVRSWSKKRSGQQKDSRKTLPPRPISAEAVPQSSEQTIKKSTSLVELKTLCRKLQRHFTATGACIDFWVMLKLWRTIFEYTRSQMCQ